MDRSFDYRDFVGYTNSVINRNDQMPYGYDASRDVHARAANSEDASVQEPNILTLNVDTLRHNIMRSCLEVSEWLGDAATEYGSHNGFVSRKMSLAWLFNAIKALINWKLNNQDKWAEVDIYPLTVNGKADDNTDVKERFLSKGEPSTQ